MTRQFTDLLQLATLSSLAIYFDTEATLTPAETARAPSMTVISCFYGLSALLIL